jgi:hypothetical protein
MCFKFLTNLGFPRYKIGKKGHTLCSPSAPPGQLSARFQRCSELNPAKTACFARETLLTPSIHNFEEKRAVLVAAVPW